MSVLTSSARLMLAAAGVAAALLASALPTSPSASPASLGAGLTFLYQNDLSWERAADANARQPGYILLGGTLTQRQAEDDCKAIGESLASLPERTVEAGMQSQLSYLLYSRDYKAGQKFRVGGGNVVVLSAASKVVVSKTKASPETRLPAICTQSAPWNAANSTDASEPWQVSVTSGDATFVGYRDALSFRFLAVPYANKVERFAYSTVYHGKESQTCLKEGRFRQCPQRAGTDSLWTEQCLVTNIFTPYLPTPSQAANRQNLRPIALWIHGGGYTSGSGLDFTFDGGNLASRSDMVVLTANYRLGALGHLAYDDKISGNYGLGDLVTVLKWIQKYGPTFGGDPSRVTIIGQSAGAQHITHLLGSPAAAGLFHGAIVMSGKGQDSTFTYPTIQEARISKTQALVEKLGCGDAADKLACLRQVDVEKFLDASYTQTVRDGRLIDAPRLDMRRPNRATGHVNRVPVIWGHMRDEKASLGRVPPKSVTDLRDAMTYAGIKAADQTKVVDSPAAFPVSRYGVQNLTVTVDTDVDYACGIEAMAYASAANNVFPRTYAYVYDQRSWQIPNYSPNGGVCEPQNGDPASRYFFAHSGDLMTVFGTVGSAFRLPYRDAKDLPWITLVVDQISSFVRTGSPAPSPHYLRARGREFALTLARATKGDGRWSSLGADDGYRSMSLGPTQRMTDLGRPSNQCQVLGKPLEYIANIS